MRINAESRGGRDAVVVGGGVVGLSAARELARRGLSVALTERGHVGAEASWAAGGMLAPQSEAERADAFFRLACAARDLYPDLAAALREETGVDIELDQTGTLYVALTDADAAECEHRYSWQSRAGLAVEQLTGDEARALEPNVSPRAVAALRFPSDWQVESRRLVAALALSARRAGVRIYEHTEASSILTSVAGRVRGIETSRGTLEADAVVVACGAWTSLLSAGDEAGAVAAATAAVPRVEPVRGQMLCYEMGAAAPFVRHVVYSPRGYLVPRRDGRLLAGSTTERVGFDKSVTARGRAEIVSHAEEIAPALRALRLADEWAGLRPRADDDWPVIGPHAGIKNLFYATAHYRNGILLAPLTGRLVAEMIAGEAADELILPFSPERFRSAATCAG